MKPGDEVTREIIMGAVVAGEARRCAEWQCEHSDSR